MDLTEVAFSSLARTCRGAFPLICHEGSLNGQGSTISPSTVCLLWPQTDGLQMSPLPSLGGFAHLGQSI